MLMLLILYNMNVFVYVLCLPIFFLCAMCIHFVESPFLMLIVVFLAVSFEFFSILLLLLLLSTIRVRMWRWL